LSKALDRILVIDLESTCWEGRPPDGHVHEIIEIGLCVLDVATGLRLDNPSILVKPERSAVSAYCTELTTLTQEEVDGGVSFSDACRLLREEYDSERRLWASYGDYDRKQFKRQCAESGIAYPFGDGHINVKSLFAVVHNLSREVRLDKAMHMKGWALEGIFHRGGDDAWNIARLLGDILLKAR